MVSVETWPQTIQFHFDELESQLRAGSYCPASVPDLTDVFGLVWGENSHSQVPKFCGKPSWKSGGGYLIFTPVVLEWHLQEAHVLRCNVQVSTHIWPCSICVHYMGWHVGTCFPSEFCIYLPVTYLMKASFVVLNKKAHEWHGAAQPPYLFPLLCSTSLHSRTRKQTHTPKSFCRSLKHNVRKHPDPALWSDKHLSPDRIHIFPEISFLNATPRTMELLSEPTTGHRCSDSSPSNNNENIPFSPAVTWSEPWESEDSICINTDVYCGSIKTKTRERFDRQLLVLNFCYREENLHGSFGTLGKRKNI